MKYVFALLTLAGIAAAAGATNYTYSRGYYYDGSGYGYTRSRYYYPASYSSGYYTPGYYAYTYNYVPDAPAYTAVTVPTVKAPVYSSNWKEEAMKTAKQIDDQKAFLEAMRVLGFYGQPNGYGLSTYSYGSYLPTQGATTYGYSVNTVRSDPYGDVKLGVMIQGLGRTTDRLIDATREANTTTMAVVSQIGEDAARIAEIDAKGRSASAVLNAAGAAPSSRTTTTVLQGSSGSAAAVQAPNMPRTADAPATGVMQILTAGCAKCHSGATKKGGFDVADFAGLTPEQKDAVRERIYAPLDSKAHMPPKGELQLTSEQKRAI